MEQNAPRLRFPGFSGAWEKKALGSIITEDLIPVPTPKNGYVRLGLHNFGKGTFYENVSPDKVLEVDKMFKVIRNHLIVNITFAWEGSVTITTELDEGKLVSHRFPQYKFNFGHCPVFYKYLTAQTPFRRSMELASPGGAGRNRVLNKKEFLKINVNTPSLPEQEKIANFFSALDEKIDLKEKEIEDVKSMKKGFLQKMFPQDGESIPRLRFPGFSGEWERKKLSQYLSVSTERNKDNIYEKKDVYSVSREKGVINQIEYQGRSFAGVSVSNYRVLKTNDIVYTKSPLKANPYGIIETNKNNPGIVSTLYAVYNPLPNVLPVFVQIYFESDFRLNNYLKPLVNIGANHDMKVKDENALKGIVTFPSLPEQKKIADFFSALDEKIDAMEKQLEDLKEMKKGFLQQMFI